jgi:hypothetical protein
VAALSGYVPLGLLVVDMRHLTAPRETSALASPPRCRGGHLPVTGEALALPLIEIAGSERVGDATFDEIFHPIARRLLARCDAVLRVGGPSQGADEMVAIARDQGKPVFADPDELP